MQPILAEGPPWDILFVGYGDWLLWRWDGFRTRSAQLCRFLADSDRFMNMYVLNESIYLHHQQRGFAVPRRERFLSLPVLRGLRKGRGENPPVGAFPIPGGAGPPQETIHNPIDSPIDPEACPLLRFFASATSTRLTSWRIYGNQSGIFDVIDDWESVSVFQTSRTTQSAPGMKRSWSMRTSSSRSRVTWKEQFQERAKKPLP